MQTAEAGIEAARKGFEAAFAEGRFYEKQTQDAAHLRAILAFLPVRKGMRILDLGAGTGYLTFALARQYPDADVTGLDIVGETLARNRQRAEQENLRNIRFLEYDGVHFPFPAGSFDMVVSRYSLHHFPAIRVSIAEISRVLTESGCFFLSDPAPNADDTEGFIDAYMRLRQDGHIRFYPQAEWETMCSESGLHLKDAFPSSIRFPRKKEPACLALLAQYDRTVKEGYAVEITDDEVYVTEQVNNLLFQKR